MQELLQTTIQFDGNIYNSLSFSKIDQPVQKQEEELAYQYLNSNCPKI